MKATYTYIDHVLTIDWPENLAVPTIHVDHDPLWEPHYRLHMAHGTKIVATECSGRTLLEAWLAMVADPDTVAWLWEQAHKAPASRWIPPQAV